MRNTNKNAKRKAIEMLEAHQRLGITLSPSTAYHPQTDGQTERVNQKIEQYLRLFTAAHQEDWSDWIPLAEFTYNNRVHSSTNESPFFLNYRHNPRIGVEPLRNSKNELATEFSGRMKRMHQEAEAALDKARREMKKFAD